MLESPDGTDPVSVACGVGANSMAMLVGMRRLGIRPDLILFADVGDDGERPATYEYKERVLRPWLRAIGFPDLVEVRYVPRHDRYTSLEGNLLANQTLPSLAFGYKGCSLKFKVEPQQKYEAGWDLAQRAWRRGGRIEKWIGYDAGPKDRLRGLELYDDDRYRYRYPLRDEWGWDRERCKEEIRADPELVAIAGAARLDPVPEKSSCWFCPANTTDEIRQLDDSHPHLADRIIAIEATARPKLRTVQGLWRRPRKGCRGTEPRPADMTTFILAYRQQKALRSLPVLQPAPPGLAA
ncbi:MAG: hypothetical protein AB1941_00680 [Gemmatimonadota bacterium]